MSILVKFQKWSIFLGVEPKKPQPTFVASALSIPVFFLWFFFQKNQDPLQIQMTSPCRNKAFNVDPVLINPMVV